MPRIPQKGSSSVDPNVFLGRVGRGDTGQEEMALAKAGGQVGDFAINLMKKRKQAADTNYAMNSYLEDARAISEFENYLKLNSSGDHGEYQSSMENFINKRFEDRIKNAPNSDAAQLYKSRSQGYFEKQKIEAGNYQRTNAAKFYLENMEDSIDSHARSYVANPDYNDAASQWEGIERDIDINVGVHYNENQAAQLKQDTKNKYAESILQGLENNERFGEGLNLLKKDSKDERQLFDSMDPDKKARWIKRFKSMSKTKQTQFNAEIQSRANDIIYQSLQGDKIDPKAIASVEQAVRNSSLKGPKKQRILDSMGIAKTIGNELQDLAVTPRSEWKSPEDTISLRPSAFNARQRVSAVNMLGSQMQRIVKEQESDAAGYLIRNYPEMASKYASLDPNNPADLQNFVTESLARQDALGIKNKRVTTVNDAKSKVQLINGANAEDAANSIVGLKQLYGDHAPRVFDELIQQGLNSDYLIVAHIPNPSVSRDFIANIKQQKSISSDYKAQESSISVNELNKMISSETEDFESALRHKGVDGTSKPFLNAMRKQVMLESKKMVLDDPGLDMDDAIEKASDKVYGSNFMVVQGANSKTLIPRVTPSGRAYDQKLTESFIKSHSTKDYFNSIDLFVPEGFKAKFSQKDDVVISYKGTKVVKQSLKSAKDSYAKYLADNAFWEANADGDGLILMVNDRGQKKVITDSEGNEIAQSLQEINFNADILTAEENKGTLEKFFRFFDKPKAKAVNK